MGTALRRLGGFTLVAVVALTVVGYYQQRDLPREEPRPLVGKSLGGELLDLQQMAGSAPVVVYFWATWCGYCRVVSPAVAELAREHQVITVALQSGAPEEVRAYLQENRLRFPTINDPSGALSARWGVRVTPTIVIVDSNGDIAWVTSGSTTKWGLQWRLAFTD
ncbi:protein disulfide oxidoreductase [Microbulbifer yueqingensis]|uniref:Thiol-disulfide isomerase or thioredoxin n=1 Tax=Microbulbifer yueqingensis TaxID=658219 RepID=A0A1G8X0E6_9GAMM|nr:protein disulfide oxidoreductase [Microbulbifer yueqingensis]SDJ83230.1 Thiol-disulfide isomerase or thioredoxin [Microbulbifer yueqingensis]